MLGVLLVLGSVLLGARVVASARNTYPRLAATRDLAAGTVLTSRDVAVAQVRLAGGGSGVYVADLVDAIGKQLSRPLSAGELVPRGALDVPAAQTTVTVPLDSGAAPDLRRGERIEMWLSTTACPSVVLLRDVPVQAVHADSGGSFATGGDAQDVVISLPPALADRVVQALAYDGAKLRAGVLAGPLHPEDGALADIAPCAAAAAPR
jgi:hypothetical protein